MSHLIKVKWGVYVLCTESGAFAHTTSFPMPLKKNNLYSASGREAKEAKEIVLLGKFLADMF